MSLQPIVLYSAPSGPNPWKVAIILAELGLPYTTCAIWNPSDLKKAPFTDVNPNGRAPAIEDPNTGVSLWESCAIISYLVTEYDKSHTLTYSTSPEKYLLDQWLFFQASGQGPYYGQGAWFNLFHPEKLPSAQARYANEISRVVGVLDGALSKSPSGWLVGDKCTYVDLAFVMWDEQVDKIMSMAPASEDGKWDAEKFPTWKKWHERMVQRPAVKGVLEEKKEMLAAKGH